MNRDSEFNSLSAASAWSGARYGKRIPVGTLRNAIRRGDLKARPVYKDPRTKKVVHAWRVRFEDLDIWVKRSHWLE